MYTTNESTLCISSEVYCEKLLCQGWIKILISILRQTIILEKVMVARYKIQPVHLTKKNKDKTQETKVIFFFSSCSPEQLLTDTSVFWIQYLTDKNGLYFSFHIKIRVLLVV